MSVRPVDPARSRIVLVGTAVYRDEQLPDIPQVSANLADLAAVFTDPELGGFPGAHCVTAPPQARVDEIGDLLHEAADEAEDLLLFYFAGHGVLDRNMELYLGLHDTRFRAPEYSALRFETVRGTFLDSKASNRVVIVDSCYSGRAITPTLGGEDQAILGQLEIGGTYTLASTPPNSLALVRDDETHTAFTGRLLHLLREGTPAAGQLLSLGDIYRQLHTRLRADGLPLPQQRGTATADLLGLVRNRGASVPVGAETTPGLRERAEPVLDSALLFAADIVHRNKSDVLTEIAVALAALDSPRRMDFFERATQIATTIRDDEAKCRALAGIATALMPIAPARAGNLIEHAESIAATMPGYHLEFRAVAAVAKALATTEPDRAAELLEQTLRVACANPHQSALTLPDIVEAASILDHYHAAGVLDEVERVALTIVDRHPRDIAEVAAALAVIDVHRAERLAARIDDEFFKCQALAAMGSNLATADPGRAAALFDEAVQIVLTPPNPPVPKAGGWGARLVALALGTSNGPDARSSIANKPSTMERIAATLAGAAPERALELLGRVGELERTYRVRASGLDRDRALASAAIALAATDPDRSESIVASLKDLSERDRARAGIARALMSSDLDRALATARTCSAWNRSHALAEIARTVALRDPDRAEYLVSTITDPDWRPIAMAGLAKAWLTNSTEE